MPRHKPNYAAFVVEACVQGLEHMRAAYVADQAGAAFTWAAWTVLAAVPRQRLR
jgi:hypothetical protein